MTTSAITRSTTLRRAAALIAAIGWLALALQMLVTVTLTLRAEQSLPVALWRYAGYFTILTNVLMAMTMTRVARGRLVVASAREASTVTGVVLAIAIVGVVYEVLLSAVVPPMGPVWWTADRMLHYVVPTLAVLWWLVFVPTHALGVRDPVRWLAYPVVYLVYALTRGAFDDWYPYFFIDVVSLGYPRVLMNAALLSVGMLAAGSLVVGLVRFTTRRA